MLTPEQVLRMPSDVHLTEDQFLELCQLNRDFRIEQTLTGDILIMPPTGTETGNRENNLAGELYIWAKQDGTGISFSSSTGFKLSGITFSPDASWMKLEKWNSLPQEEKTKFAAICPDFVAEIKSPSDNLEDLKEKMQLYIREGALLGWLIDRKYRKVYIYRPEQTEECLDNPNTLSGETVLPGFVLDMNLIW